MTDPILRTANPDDLTAVLRIIREEGLLVDGIEEGLAEGWVLAEAEGRLVGCAAVETWERDGMLRSVAVVESHRGTRLGRRLIENREDWARDRGLVTLSLFTITADEFFRHLGYQQVERNELPATLRASIEFEHGCCASARAFTRSLE